MKFEYKNQGVCSSKVTFEVENDLVKNVAFIGGCSGNTQGLAVLVEGMHIDEVIRRIGGIHCGSKQTSCPDQLSKALIRAKEKLAKI